MADNVSPRTAASNPDLQPERAINYRIGWKSTFAQANQVLVTGTYADVKDIIQSVPTGAFHGTSPIPQNRNVGDGYRYGVDMSVDHQISDKLAVGGNLSLLHPQVNSPTTATLHQTGFPDAKAFPYATWRPTDTLTVRPSPELSDGNRISQTVSGGTRYFQTDSYSLANLSAEYDVSDRFKISAGVNNMLDTDYATVYGSPAQGRSFFISAKATF